MHRLVGLFGGDLQVRDPASATLQRSSRRPSGHPVNCLPSTSRSFPCSFCARGQSMLSGTMLQLSSRSLTTPHLPKNRRMRCLSLTHTTNWHILIQVLEKLQHALRSGARFVVTDHTRPSQAGDTREAEIEHHEIAPDIVQADLMKVGFQIVGREDHFAVQPKTGKSGG